MPNLTQAIGKVMLLTRRIAATALDFTLLLLTMGALGALCAYITAHLAEIPNLDALKAQYPDADSRALFETWYEGIARGLVPYFLAMLPMVWWLYESLCIWRRGSTIGKWLLRLTVVSGTAKKLSIWCAIFRTAMKMSSIALALIIPGEIAMVAFLLGWFALPLATKNGRMLYDFITDVSVVSRRKKSLEDEVLLAA